MMKRSTQNPLNDNESDNGFEAEAAAEVAEVADEQAELNP